MRALILLILPALLLHPVNSLAVVRISNMNDFSFGTWSGSGNLQATDGVCIYDTQAANTTYRITMTGSGAGGAFTLASGANTLAYSPAFAGTSGVFTTMTSGTSVTFSTPNNASTTCGGSTNAQIRVTITQANMLAVDSGTYTGVLTVLLRP